jgi:hypothetical protein
MVLRGLLLVVRALSFAIVLALPLSLRAESPKPLTKAQQERLKERDKYAQQMAALHKEGKFQDVIAVAEKSLAITREVFGDNHEEIANLLETVARMKRGARQTQ